MPDRRRHATDFAERMWGKCELCRLLTDNIKIDIERLTENGGAIKARIYQDLEHIQSLFREERKNGQDTRNAERV